MTTQPAAAAGWYADPTMAHTLRYWNGADWTDHRAPAAQVAAGAVFDDPHLEVSEGVKVVGVLLALLIPIVGFIIGLTQINKRGNDGLVIVCISVIAFFVWIAVLSG